MSTLGPVLLDLASEPWSELDAGERSAYRLWLETARPEDVHLLLHEARRRWRRRARSSSQTLAVQRELAAADEKETPC